MSLKHPNVAAPSFTRAVTSYRRALILVTCLFFLWGLSYGLLDVLNKHFQETLHVSKAQSGLLQSAYFGAYFLIALPAGLLMDRYGYKAGILLGLCLYATGALLFMPAAAAQSFQFFLFALFVIACGLGCLETAANPYATVLGSPAGAERRLDTHHDAYDQLCGGHVPAGLVPGHSDGHGSERHRLGRGRGQPDGGELPDRAFLVDHAPQSASRSEFKSIAAPGGLSAQDPAFVGFDRYTPLEVDLMTALAARGTERR